jgi:peptidoglycan/LPS O-acetylase OafA/YrhL
MLLAGIVIVAIKYIPINTLNNHSEYLRSHGLLNFFTGWRFGDEIFNITFYMIWFLPGVIFYQRYKGFDIKQNVFSAICVLVVLFCMVWDTRVFFADSFYVTMIACLLMFGLFFLMIYQKKYLSYLANPLFVRIGVISYTIYLIHEEIGVLLINKYGKYLGSWSALSPFIIIIIVSCFAELSFRFYERKVSGFLRRL